MAQIGLIFNAKGIMGPELSKPPLSRLPGSPKGLIWWAVGDQGGYQAGYQAGFQGVKPIGKQTRNRRGVWILGTVLAVLLGGITTVLGLLVGPVLQVVQAPQQDLHLLTSMIGDFWGGVFGRLLGRESLTGTELLLMGPWALMGCATAKALVTASHWYLWEYTGEWASRSLRDALSSRFTALDPTFRLTKKGRSLEAQIATAMTQDIRQMREYLVHYYGGLPREMFQMIALGLSLVLLSGTLTGIFFGAILPVGILVRYIGRRIRKRSQAVLQNQAELSEWLQQRLMGIETIKHYQTEMLESQKFAVFNKELANRFTKAIATKARTSPTIEVFSTIAFVLVLWVSLQQIHSGDLSGPVFFSFFTSLALMSQSASKLGKYFNSNKEGYEAVSRIWSILKELGDHKSQPLVLELNKTTTSSGLEPTLQCRNLYVRYPGASVPALQGINLDFFPHKIYCLKGASGSGKSTIFKVLLGLVRPEQGVIIWSQSVLDHPYPICYLPQKIIPLSASIASNVVYPLPSGDPEKVKEALERVGLDTLVQNMPIGVETPLGVEGQVLSGGQLQRVLLARLWYHQSPVVLIDEGTSALDPELERLVHKLFRELADRGATLILIAHRPTQIAFADEVISLSHGFLGN